MPTFTLHCTTPLGTLTQLQYDSERNTLTHADGSDALGQQAEGTTAAPWRAAQAWCRDNPALKHEEIRRLKISLGLKCNYACGYCSQRFVPGVDEAQAGKVEAFLERLPRWFKGGSDGQGTGVRIEFWGGEPLVYWKTLKPLVEAMAQRYPKASLLMITNGSLLDAEKNEWIERMGLNIGLSHDGPGYHVRGQDPLDDEQQRAAILDLYRRLQPKGRISINAMLNRANSSRAAVQRFMQEVFGPEVRIGEGSLIDTYDGDALALALRTPQEHVQFRRQALAELRSGAASNFMLVHDKLSMFAQALRHKRPKAAVMQKCGIDDPGTLIVDLAGQVLTCQNVSAAAVAPNGESHLCGTVEDLAAVRVRTITSWQHREACRNCPVLHLCQGGCTFLEGELFEASCDHSYSDNIPFFVAAIEYLTGCVPYYIEGEGLSAQRRDLFGWIHPEALQLDKPQRRVFELKQVAA